MTGAFQVGALQGGTRQGAVNVAPTTRRSLRRGRVRWQLALLAVLLFATALQAARVARHYRAARVEIGEHRPSRLDEATRNALAKLSAPVTLTYVATARDAMPSRLRRVESDVRDVLGAIERASAGKVRWRVVDPDTDEAARRFVTRRRIAPYRVRSVSRDAFTEIPVYSSLEIADSAGHAALVDGIDADLVQRLGPLVVEHLELFQSQSRPRIALAAPDVGFDGLRAAIDARAERIEVDLDGATYGDAELESADLLIWLAPGSDEVSSSARAIARVEAFRAGGGGVLIAGSRRRAIPGELDGAAAVRFERTGFRARDVLAAFGLSPRLAPIFDERCEVMVQDGIQVQLPFLVRSIAPNQDFRRQSAQPAGSLVFGAPTPFALQSDELFARGFEARVLATSSELTFALAGLDGDELPPPQRLDALRRDAGSPLPKQPLLVWLDPADPWQGPVVAMASPDPFVDGFFEQPGYAHGRLLEILLDDLTSQERLVSARAEIRRPAPIGELSRAAELGWRFAVIGMAPLLLACLAVARALRGAFGSSGRSGARLLTTLALILAPVLVAALLGVALGVLPKGFAASEVGSDALERLSPTTIELGATLSEQRGDVALEWIGSRSDRLSPALRAATRRAHNSCLDFVRRVPAARFERTTPEDLDDAQRAALAERGIASFSDRSLEDGETTVRQVWSTLAVTSGDATERLDFPDAASFENFEFRLGFALWRLAQGRTGANAPLIALASDSPRLSPAEAHTEFQQRQLFAPSGTDVYSLARATLERTDFRVQHIDPRSPVLPADFDALFWLQPRRLIQPLLEPVTRYLNAGGRVFLAAQHFVIRAERHRGRDFEDVYWPQPQMTDVEQLYFPELGIELAREVLFDASNFAAPLVTHVNRTGEEREYSDQASAEGFLVRATTLGFADDLVLRGVGELLLPFPNEIRLDPERLAAAGLDVDVLATTTDAAWSFPWKGGFLPTATLDGPNADAPEVGAVPLLIRVSGNFPLPQEPIAEPGAEGRPALEISGAVSDDGRGTLILLGSSQALRDEELLRNAESRAAGRADRLLINAAAELCLPPELAELAGRRSVPRTLPSIPAERKLAWRAGVTAAPLGLVLLLGLGWLLISRKLAHTAKERGQRLAEVQSA